MKVLAFDLATQTGIAWGTAGETPQATSVDIGKGLPESKRFANLIDAVSLHIETYKPAVVAYEAPVGGKEASAYLIGLSACLRGAAALYGYDAECVMIGTYRRHFLGKHYIARDFPSLSKAKAKTAIKQMVMDRCKMLGWKPDDFDQADAMAIHDFVCAKHRAHQSVPAGGLF